MLQILRCLYTDPLLYHVGHSSYTPFRGCRATPPPPPRGVYPPNHPLTESSRILPRAHSSRTDQERKPVISLPGLMIHQIFISTNLIAKF